MKIKSLVDIITNSSSECYQIKNTQGITAEEFKEKWFNELVRQGVYDKDGNCLDEFCKDSSFATDTLLGDIYSEDDYLYLDYPVLCNIDFDILKVLKDALFLDIDENFSATCKYILDNFEIIEHDGGKHFLVFDEKGEKIVKVLNSWKEWREENLTRLQRYGKVVSENYDWD